MSNDLEARVAIMEVKIDHLEKTDDKMDMVLTKLNKLEGQLATSKSFVGGVVFIISCFWALFVAFKDVIIHGAINR